MSAPTKPRPPAPDPPNGSPSAAEVLPTARAVTEDAPTRAVDGEGPAKKVKVPLTEEQKEARRIAKARRAEAKAAKESRPAAAETEIVPTAETTRPVGGWGSRTQWLVSSVVGLLVFQVVHSAEHVAQFTFWLTNPDQPAWMSRWAMAAVTGLGALSGGGAPMGMELLHLIGNGLFLLGLLLAARVPERYRTPEAMKWLRIATVIQAAHVAEHVLLTLTLAVGGKAAGVSTMFGLTDQSSPAAVGYRVFFHLAVNLVAITFALKALLAARGMTAGTRTKAGRIGYGILAAPLAGLVFLLPVFGAPVHSSASASPDAVLATVNGVEITSAELDAAMADIDRLTAEVQLGTAPVGETGGGTAPAAGAMSEELRMLTTMNRLVQNVLIEQGAAQLGVSITAADIEARKQELIASDFLDRAGFDAFLERSGASEAYADSQIASLLLQERVHETLTAGQVIAPEAVQATFAAQYDGAPRARQLLTLSEPLARTFLAQVQGGADFESLVRTESTDPRAASTGGYVGPVKENLQVPEVVTAVQGMQDGEFQVVRTQFGWHVIQRLAPATLPEVEAEIRANLALVAQANAGQEWLAQIRAAADVSVTEGFGVWNTTFGAVVSPSFTG